eukprot:COSAG01_NODE_48245_length_383_cov_0.464789_1_plen_97_part_01
MHHNRVELTIIISGINKINLHRHPLTTTDVSVSVSVSVWPRPCRGRVPWTVDPGSGVAMDDGPALRRARAAAAQTTLSPSSPPPPQLELPSPRTRTR